MLPHVPARHWVALPHARLRRRPRSTGRAERKTFFTVPEPSPGPRPVAFFWYHANTDVPAGQHDHPRPKPPTGAPGRRPGPPSVSEAAPPVRGLLEIGLYVADVDASIDFYRPLFGFPVLFHDHRMAALDVAGSSVLLLFRQGASTERVETPAGILPPHDARGEIHAAFAIDADQLVHWVRRLDEHGVEIEGRMSWPRGGESLYFRDPDGHLLEVATPGLWATY